MASITIGLPGAGKVMVDDAALEGPGGFGTAVASADFNRDGKADLAIGAPTASAVTVFYGGDDGLGDARKTDLGGDNGFGTALVAGDFNGDGYGDLAVGAPGGDGTIRIDPGGEQGPERAGARSRSSRPATLKGAFGSVLAVGDVDNDGRARPRRGRAGRRRARVLLRRRRPRPDRLHAHFPAPTAARPRSRSATSPATSSATSSQGLPEARHPATTPSRPAPALARRGLVRIGPGAPTVPAATC